MPHICPHGVLLEGRSCAFRVNGGPVATRTPDLYRVKVAFRIANDRKRAEIALLIFLISNRRIRKL